MRPRTGAGKLDCHAALVWAWTEETKGGRPSKTCPKVGRLSLSEFAALGIRGLTKRDTVAKYRAAWQWAIDAQEDVVRWWEVNVRGAGKPVIISDSEIITAAQAEKIIGFSAVQVSRWRKKLAEFVAWWREKVRGDGRPSKTVADRGQLSATDAESLTGITKQQVSRWAKALEDRDKQGGSRFAEFAKARFGMAKARASMWVTIGENIKLFSNAEQFSADWTAFYEFTRLEVAP